MITAQINTIIYIRLNQMTIEKITIEKTIVQIKLMIFALVFEDTKIHNQCFLIKIPAQFYCFNKIKASIKLFLKLA